MRMIRYKIVQKLCYDLHYNRPPYCLVIVVILIVITFGWIYVERRILVCIEPGHMSLMDKNWLMYEPIDAVYTWVNGSDPDFIQSIRMYNKDYDKSRFDDKNELKFSLRSLVKFTPWIRHVYIVTNGQIPHWLDLENKKITVISHWELCENTSILPTFSSAVIETFIHRIPNLSKHFLYLNDDIFIGQMLYPDDLYTHSEGIKIFTAWSVPDCAPGCPWAYIGDKSCDTECNVEPCQYDGGDCNTKHKNKRETKENLAIFHEVPKIKYPKTSFINILKINNNKTTDRIPEAVRTFNRIQSEHIKQLRKRNIRYALAKTTTTSSTVTSNTSKDMFAKSLIHTNKIFNKIYGFKARKVIAHVGFLLDINIVDEMLQTYAKYFQLTQSHRIRHPNDMQFAFSYFHHLIAQTVNLTSKEIFDEFDTDKSGSWSDREIRTLLSRIYPLPLDWGAVRYFEEVVTNCTQYIAADHSSPFPTLLYERYEDSNIPHISKELIIQCNELTDVLHKKFANQPKYRFSINQKTSMQSNFKMLTSNVSQVVDALDELRRTPKKFNCINDDLDAAYPEENQLIIALLEDFYLSLFPEKSPFELPDNYRNRFLHLFEYNRWIQNKYKISIAVYSFCIVMFVVGVRLMCMKHRVRFVRKFGVINCLYLF